MYLFPLALSLSLSLFPLVFPFVACFAFLFLCLSFLSFALFGYPQNGGCPFGVPSKHTKRVASKKTHPNVIAPTARPCVGLTPRGRAQAGHHFALPQRVVRLLKVVPPGPGSTGCETRELPMTSNNNNHVHLTEPLIAVGGL